MESESVFGLVVSRSGAVIGWRLTTAGKPAIHWIPIVQMHDATFADFRPPAAAWRSAVPADGDYFALSLRLRGGFDPSVVTGLVLGFVLARMLSPPPPPPGPAG